MRRVGLYDQGLRTGHWHPTCTIRPIIINYKIPKTRPRYRRGFICLNAQDNIGIFGGGTQILRINVREELHVHLADPTVQAATWWVLIEVDLVLSGLNVLPYAPSAAHS